MSNMCLLSLEDLLATQVMILINSSGWFESEVVYSLTLRNRITSSVVNLPFATHCAYHLRDGNYRVDADGTPTMLNCLMYKLCYYRFAETDGKGFDRVRRYEIGNNHFKLTHFEEVFTTHHWMVQIYKLKPQKNRIRGKLKLKSSSKTSSMRKVGGKKNPW